MNESRTIPTPASADLSTVTIKINGEDLDRTFNIVTISVIKEINRIPTATLVFLDGSASDSDFPLSNSELLIPGNEIEILAGYHSDEATIFKGRIVKHKIKIRKQGASLCIVEGKDSCYQLAIGNKSRYFFEKSDSDLIEEIISDYSLNTDIESMSVVHPQIVQYNSTDWDFIMMRADINGKFCIINDGTITIKAPDFSPEAVVTLQYGATILEYDAEIDGRHQLNGIMSRSWDFTNQEQVELEAAEPQITEAGNLLASDISSALELDSDTLLHGGSISEEMLQTWADAKLQKHRMAKIRGRVKFQGLADVLPGTIISVNGVGERLSGDLFVSGIRHTIANGQWETDAQFGIEPSWFSDSYVNSIGKSPLQFPPITGIHTGIVTALEGDPDGENRIKVKLPIVNVEEEGCWMRLATLDAGNERGTFFRPEIDDEVVVGFLHEDPTQPVVLGMLHSSAKPTPQEITDDNHQKGYVSREKLKVTFDDEKKSITLETPAEKKITLDEDSGAIALEDENGNVLKLDSDGVTIESAKDIILTASGDIKLEGVNIESNAQAEAKLVGSAGAELSSGATVTVQGSMVNIN